MTEFLTEADFLASITIAFQKAKKLWEENPESENLNDAEALFETFVANLEDEFFSEE